MHRKNFRFLCGALTMAFSLCLLACGGDNGGGTATGPQPQTAAGNPALLGFLGPDQSVIDANSTADALLFWRAFQTGGDAALCCAPWSPSPAFMPGYQFSDFGT